MRMEELLNFKDILKDIRRKIILNSYYTRKIKDGKGAQATLVDWIFITLVLTMFFLITVFNSTKSVLASISITAILMGFFIAIALMWKGKIRARKIVSINDQLATEQIGGQLDGYGNRDFIAYARELLENYYSTTFNEHHGNIDLIGEIDGDTYGVKCIKIPPDTKVVLRNVEYFIADMEKGGVEEGIIICNTSFADEVREETDYLLLGFEQIKDMLSEGDDGYPNREEIEALIVDRYDMGRKELVDSISFHGKGKILRFILLGVVFYLVSPIVSYPLYYRVAALISISYGLIVGIYDIALYIRNRREESI